MKFYFAPLEGITGYIYRNAFESVFGEIDKYFTPFVVANKSRKFKTRELKDVQPENNRNINVIPQILTNNAEYFINTEEKLKELGYDEINLNLGCPSGTVVSKFKGSGFLKKREELDRFFDEVFSKTKVKISVKTRIGIDKPDEFYELIKIYNKYPLEELIIHPRTQQDFYRNEIHMDIFEYALKESKNPVCYNGDIFNINNYNNLIKRCPSLERIMLGRGLICNPGLILEIRDGLGADNDKLRLFHKTVYSGYKEVLYGDKNVLFKMKEFWSYMIQLFYDNEKYKKKIRKCMNINEYETIVNCIFNDLKIESIDKRGFSAQKLKL
ncbi:tRNA-dihydrouridine synthase [Clostridium sp. BJN0001]|uniref:tRNA dihydrouridine synthase n=1 Tax=Clostridium sp. BJN0001 TaxID=2930219 RepID=UPI001FD49FEE|nr:tRNA-dihydrouridine synthase [Clostridium sp. BJN0001]